MGCVRFGSHGHEKPLQDTSGARSPMTLVVQIPAWNEEATLPGTLADLPREVPGAGGVAWLVVDDGSSDATAAVARAHGADRVVRLPVHRGLAAAFRTGLE